MGGDGSVKRIEDRAALLGAGGTHRPEPLAPLPSGLPPRALRHPPVDHHKPQRLLGKVVRGLGTRRRDEAEVGLTGSRNTRPGEPVMPIAV